jgi:hypothetical protein
MLKPLAKEFLLYSKKCYSIKVNEKLTTVPRKLTHLLCVEFFWISISQYAGFFDMQMMTNSVFHYLELFISFK